MKTNCPALLYLWSGPTPALEALRAQGGKRSWCNRIMGVRARICRESAAGQGHPERTEVLTQQEGGL